MYTPEARPPTDPPALFGVGGLLFLFGVTLVAARLSAPWVALLAGSLLLVGLGARVWARFCLVGLAYSRTILAAHPAGAQPPPPSTLAPHPSALGTRHSALTTPTVRAFCGDTLVLETRLSNRKLLPLPWVEAWERLPLALDPGGDLAESLEVRDQAWLCQGASLWPYQRARWQHHLACRRRGAFTLGAVRVRAGDPFGLGERETSLADRLEVVVYPRVVPLRRLGLPLRHPAMDLATRRSLIADPTRTAWVRDYQPGDPPRLIHWPATAHQGRLQVRVLEPATTLQVHLVLDPAAFDVVLSLYRGTLFELAVSALASIAVYLNQVGYPIGLVTTTRPAAALSPSANPAQLETLLERLARVEPERGLPRPPGHGGVAVDVAPTAPGGDGRQRLPASSPRRLSLPRGSAVILATSDLALDLAETVAGLEHAGHQVIVLLATSGVRAPALGAERVVRLLPDADLAAVLEGAALPTGRR